ncbi:hypothetical protein BGX27_009572 [Mortierella sp. AM989]|nr:hypothetical protein BGX27_009572 [Mortierella sp. AM989]
MTGKEPPVAPTLYPHSVDFAGRPPPPHEGYSWEQIKEAIDSNSLHILRRTDKGQYEYEQWQKKIDRTKYKNAGEYIAFAILNWPDLKDPAEEISTTTNDLPAEERYRTTEPRLTLRLNHYPIPIHKSIQYFVLWSTRDMSLPQERERLDKYLNLQLGIPGTPGIAPELLPPSPGEGSLPSAQLGARFDYVRTLDELIFHPVNPTMLNSPIK